MYYISKLTETRLVTVLKGEYCEEISNVKLGRDRNECVLANALTAYRFPTQPPAYGAGLEQKLHSQGFALVER